MSVKTRLSWRMEFAHQLLLLKQTLLLASLRVGVQVGEPHRPWRLPFSQRERLTPREKGALVWLYETLRTSVGFKFIEFA
ncbi:hypothetical protein [Nostoc sp.]|uniref:hypothetical protein n=1 Tax=Nostoc sp. TaxID=1180 RepID=UPI002FF53D4E